MKTIIITFALLAVTVAAPANPDANAVILRQKNNNDGLGTYDWLSETSNGIYQDEQGQLNNAGQENEAIAVHGQFHYTGSDGKVYSVSYIADENGFQPSGNHLA